MWDTLNMVDSCGRIVFVIVYVTDEVQHFKKREIVGYFTPICDVDLKRGLSGESIDKRTQNTEHRTQTNYLRLGG